MNAGDDNVFARWSRRKQAARSSASEAPIEEHAPKAIAAEAVTEPVDQQPAATEPDTPEPLPSLEDLTAEGDLSAFLRKGVPKALKNAAMRKMWSLDPEIRDYVGPSEYAWDFNQPGSMAGFGPLDAKKTVVDFLSTVSRGIQTNVTEAAAAPNAPEAQPPKPSEAVPTGRKPGASDDRADLPSPGELPESAQPTASQQPDSSNQVKTVTDPRQASGPAESPGVAVRPRHGSAMPR